MPRHQFRRALATCLMIASALLALLPESVAAEQRAVRFRMDWIPSGMYAPFFYGYDAGVFTKNGIDLDIVNGNGSLTTIADVDAGNVKFGMAGCAAAALAISKGRKIISIASYMAKYSWAFYVPEDSAFKNISDLRGKSVVVAPNSSEILLLPAVLKYAGVNPEEMKRVAVDPAQKIATYARGVGDSTITTMAYGDPLVQQAKPSRALLWSDAGFVMPDYCVIASTDTVAKDPELVASFLKATFESVAASEKNSGAAVDASLKLRPLIQRAPTEKQWELTMSFLRSDNTKACPLGWQSPKDWDIGLKTLKEYAGLEGDISNPDLFYTNKFITCSASK
jgi:NitT/TauT family transport system substrate-binding protein